MKSTIYVHRHHHRRRQCLEINILREKNVIVCKKVVDDSNRSMFYQPMFFMDDSLVPCDLVLAFRTATNRPPVGVSILA